jgi:hypothetical protein
MTAHAALTSSSRRQALIANEGTVLFGSKEYALPPIYKPLECNDLDSR